MLPVVGPGPAGRRTARYTSAEKVVLEAQLGYKLNLCLPVAQRWAFFGILNGRQSDGCIFGRYKEGYAKFYYLDGLHNCDCHLDGSLLCTDAICPLRDRHHGSSHRSKRTGQGRYTSLAPSSEGKLVRYLRDHPNFSPSSGYIWPLIEGAGQNGTELHLENR